MSSPILHPLLIPIRLRKISAGAEGLASCSSTLIYMHVLEMCAMVHGGEVEEEGWKKTKKEKGFGRPGQPDFNDSSAAES